MEELMGQIYIAHSHNNHYNEDIFICMQFFVAGGAEMLHKISHSITYMKILFLSWPVRFMLKLLKISLTCDGQPYCVVCQWAGLLTKQKAWRITLMYSVLSPPYRLDVM